MLSFRDRISVATWVVGLILALQPILLAPRWNVTWYPLGTPLTVSVDRDFVLGMFLFAAVVGGTQWVLAAWDLKRPGVRFREGAWTLPLAIGWLALRLLPHRPDLRAWVGLLVGTLLVIALSWHTLARLLGGIRAEYPARLVWRVLVFVAAGALYLWLYGLGVRSLLAATQMLVGTYLLAAALWLEMSRPASVRWLYSLITALIIAQFAWAFRQTMLSPLRAGLILLLIFYLLTALVERGVQERLNVRVVVEFLATATLALIVILLI